jgi:hypothetical protein
VFDEFPTWKSVMFLPLEVRKPSLPIGSAPEVPRGRPRQTLSTGAGTSSKSKVVKPENENIRAKTWRK